MKNSVLLRSVIVSALVAGLAQVPLSAQDGSVQLESRAARAIADLQATTGQSVTVRLSPATGVARLLRFDPAAPQPDLGPAKSLSPESRAAAFLERYGAALGVAAPDRQLRRLSVHTDRLGTSHVSYRQVYQGLPVFGTQLRVHVTESGDIRAANGNTIPDLSLDVTPRVEDARARLTAVDHVLDPLERHTQLEVAASRLLVYRAGLARGVPGANHLVYEVEVVGPGAREFVYVDAHKGHVVDRITGIHDAMSRRIYEGGFESNFLVWSEGDSTPYGDPDIDNLIDYAEDTYNFFSTLSGGDYLSWDGTDGVMHSVNDSPTISCSLGPNANWDGSSTNFCPGTTTDDVVAHEWGHAYTGRTHGLIYAWQPGALNESYSDIWGEAVDLLNGAGGDSPGEIRTVGGCNVDFGEAPLRLEILSPAGIAGTYVAGGALFNPAGEISVAGEVWPAADGGGVGTPLDGCEPLIGFPSGRIALIDRGDCDFVVKVANAQSAGAIGVVIVNLEADTILTMAGEDPNLTIPSMLIGRGAGEQIRAALAAGEVTASFTRQGTSEPSRRWLMGEDSSAFGGPIRDMWNPPCLRDPGRVSDPEYWCDETDSGGVHINSGISNHAFALLLDGGDYNGFSIAGIGLTKAAHIYWRAQLVYQIPTTGFKEHADLLELACADLIGAPLIAIDTDSPTPTPSPLTISQADCDEVAKVIQAVEFRLPVPEHCGLEPVLQKSPPALCGQDVPAVVAGTDWESGLEGWTVGRRDVSNPATFDTPDWAVVAVLPDDRQGSAAFVPNLREGDCAQDVEAGALFLESPDILIPADLGDEPRLAFDHWFALEPSFDGGNLKISVNGGGWTIVPAAAFLYNGYNAEALSPTNNPLSTEPAFTGNDGGTLSGSWGQSQVDLAALAAPGDTIRLRFEFGVDDCNGYQGWYVDEVQVYGCPCVEDGDPANQFTFYPDLDLDGFGASSAALQSCAAPDGYITTPGDCDDSSSLVNPAAAEICADAIDNDCDPDTLDRFDLDSDAFACDVDCDDANGAAWAPPSETGALTFFTGGAVLSWVPPVNRGSLSITYDLLLSELASDFVVGATCLQVQGTAALTSAVPEPGGVYFYLPRANNACPGSGGSFGLDGAGEERVGRSCN